MRRRIMLSTIAVAAGLASAASHADDPASFLSGAIRNCIACDPSARDLRQHDFKRARPHPAAFASLGVHPSLRGGIVHPTAPAPG
jgi:hypothetical protein